MEYLVGLPQMRAPMGAEDRVWHSEAGTDVPQLAFELGYERVHRRTRTLTRADMPADPPPDPVRASARTVC